MIASVKRMSAASASNHVVGLQVPASTGASSASISNFELDDSPETGADDDLLTPAASSNFATSSVAMAPVGLTSLAVASVAAIPGQGGDPALVVKTAGSGLVFVDTFTADDTTAYENCVIAAEKQLEGVITNNITLHMTFDMGVKGDTDFNHFSDGIQVKYATLKAALHKVAPNDVLPPVDPSNGGLYNLAPAYARMLGLTTSAPSDDAIVTFHTNGATWDFGQDVVNAITHGISEAGLGRVSGMGVSISDEGVVTPEPDGWEPLDLFRYTASGLYDSSDGKGNLIDGIVPNTTDYFSSDGGAQTSQDADLSFTNLFAGTVVNPDAETDADDWREDDVFGVNNAGETDTLSVTDLDVMSALGWQINLKQQNFSASSGNWENPANWANGYNPISAEDVVIGYTNVAAATLSDDVTVNSISLVAGSSLLIDNRGSLTATNGTAVSSEDTDVLYSGNDGAITVDDNSTLSVGGFFANLGSLTIEGGATFSDSAGFDNPGALAIEGSGATANLTGAVDNSGSIAVGVGASLSLSGVVQNTGTITVGAQLTDIDAVGDLILNGATTFDGGGAIDLGQITISFSSDVVAPPGPGPVHGHPVANVSTGGIFGGGALINDDAISGAGVISVGSLDNRASGSIGASIAGYSLRIQSEAVSNEGVLFADAGTSLELGVTGPTTELDNSGQINLAAGADLVIADDTSAAGSGSINFDGAGDALVSADLGPTGFANENAIVATASAQIGDAGLLNANDLSLTNDGSIVAENAGVKLTLDTGANVIQDPAGLLEAENDAQLVIDSAVQTGNPGIRPGVGAIKAAIIGPTGGTIEAASGGVVTIAAAVSEGAGNTVPGQIVIDSGTVEFLSGSSDSVPIEFTGAGGVLEVQSTATPLGAIQGVVGGDAFSVTGTSLTSATIGSSSLDIVTNSGNFDFANVLYGGAITGYVAFADPSTAGMERVLLTDGAAATLQETNSTIYENDSGANITGSGNTIDFQGSAASIASLYGTAPKPTGSTARAAISIFLPRKPKSSAARTRSTSWELQATPSVCSRPPTISTRSTATTASSTSTARRPTCLEAPIRCTSKPAIPASRSRSKAPKAFGTRSKGRVGSPASRIPGRRSRAAATPSIS